MRATDDYPEGLTSTAAWWARREADLEAEIAADRAAAQSAEGQLEVLYRRATAMDAARLDYGGHTQEACKAAWAAYHALQAQTQRAAEVEFLAEWTRESTQERRAAWNSRLQAGEFGRIGSGRVNWAALRAAEAAQGWTVEDLKRAIKLHQL